MDKTPRYGNKPYQKLKPYVILQYLLRETDENNIQSAEDIKAYLEEQGISAERRSIYRDIDEINLVNVMLEEECKVEEAKEMLLNDPDGDLNLVVYDKHKKGFYVRQRHFDLNDIRLLAECVYSAKFVSEGQAKRLVDVVCDFVSVYQAERIKHNAFLADRVKTNNKSVLNNISTINDAMSRKLNGLPHKPEKISFKYLKYSFDDLGKQVERRKGEKYIVSPYQLMINDGNYYLLAYSEKRKDIVPFRVDRMREVALAHEPRDGEEAFYKLDLRTYSQRVFSMYQGRKARIKLRFIPPLLDTMIERFGTSNAQYSKPDDRHYTVETEVEISEQFYGWLLGFGKRVKLMYPAEEQGKFLSYVDKIRGSY